MYCHCDLGLGRRCGHLKRPFQSGQKLQRGLPKLAVWLHHWFWNYTVVSNCWGFRQTMLIIVVLIEALCILLKLNTFHFCCGSFWIRNICQALWFWVWSLWLGAGPDWRLWLESQNWRHPKSRHSTNCWSYFAKTIWSLHLYKEFLSSVARARSQNF